VENPNNVKRSIRIPKDIHEKIKKTALERKISMNKVIIELLKKYF